MLFIYTYSFSVDIIFMHNKGIRGYKEVILSQNPVGSYLSCMNPGKLKCKYSSALDEIYSDIVDKVYSFCIDGASDGRFQHNEYYVTFLFDVDKDELTIKIYSLIEAHELGYV
jgi:hypothetical protein